jgi:hypothetical protein
LPAGRGRERRGPSYPLPQVRETHRTHTHTLERRTGRHTRGEKRRGKGAEAEVEAKAVAVVRTQTQGAGRYTEPKKTGESARARDLEVKSSDTAQRAGRQAECLEDQRARESLDKRRYS